MFIFNEFGEVKILGQYEKVENLSELNGILLAKLKNYLNKNYLNIVNMMGIENIPNVRIKKVKNYLGQYNKKNNSINLNLLLGHMDECLIEYVIIHELCHFLEFNHSKNFWNYVKKYKPDFKEAKKVLKEE